MWVGGINRNDYVRLVARDHLRQAIPHGSEPSEGATEVIPTINVGIQVRPELGCAIDQLEIGATGPCVRSAKRFREQIANFHFGAGRDLEQPPANAARRRVVPFTESGAENEKPFHVGKSARGR
jgi:hypothetical protein